MADAKITDLADGGQVAGTDEFVVARSGSNKKIAGSNMPATEASYVEFTSDVTITGTSSGSPTTIVTAAAVTCDGSSRYRITFFSGRVQVPSGATNAFQIGIYDGSTFLTNLAFMDSNGNMPVHLVRELVPSAASHTYSIRGYHASGGTNPVVDGRTDTVIPPGFIRVEKVT